jgi:hypothetical protein
MSMAIAMTVQKKEGAEESSLGKSRQKSKKKERNAGGCRWNEAEAGGSEFQKGRIDTQVQEIDPT